jgi:hypothetical protein
LKVFTAVCSCHVDSGSAGCVLEPSVTNQKVGDDVTSRIEKVIVLQVQVLQSWHA